MARIDFRGVRAVRYGGVDIGEVRAADGLVWPEANLIGDPLFADLSQWEQSRCVAARQPGGGDWAVAAIAEVSKDAGQTAWFNYTVPDIATGDRLRGSFLCAVLAAGTDRISIQIAALNAAGATIETYSGPSHYDGSIVELAMEQAMPAGTAAARLLLRQAEDVTLCRMGRPRLVRVWE